MKLLPRNVPLMAGLACLAAVLPTGPRTLFAGGQVPGLTPELEPLRPFLGSWIGRFDDPDETMEILATWTDALGGQAVREVRTIPGADGFEGETLYYFDRESETISFVLVTNNGYLTRGSVTFDGDHFILAGRQVGPDGSVRATNGTYTFRDDGSLVNAGGHTIVFQRR